MNREQLLQRMLQAVEGKKAQWGIYRRALEGAGFLVRHSQESFDVMEPSSPEDGFESFRTRDPTGFVSAIRLRIRGEKVARDLAQQALYEAKLREYSAMLEHRLEEQRWDIAEDDPSRDVACRAILDLEYLLDHAGEALKLLDRED